MVSRDDALFNEVSVRKWRGRLVTGDAMFCKFQGWWLWLVARPEYRGLTPTVLLEQLEESGDPRLFRKVALLVDDYAGGVGGTKANMCGVRSVVRSFFRNHNLELPRTVFNVVETRHSVKSRLDLATVKRIVVGATLRDRAVYLSILQGVMDVERFCRFNAEYGHDLGRHLQGKGVAVLFKVDFPGRKLNKNPYYTFIGRDALCAWKEYFESKRGYPGQGEPAALTNSLGKVPRALNNDAVEQTYIDLLRKRLGLIPRAKGAVHSRYGLNLHEWRDVARTSAQTMYQKNGLTVEGRVIDFDVLAVEFFMGHEVDPLAYNKFYEDYEYTRRQYRIVERRLNILSNDPEVEEVRREAGVEVSGLKDEIKRQNDTFVDIYRQMEEFKKALKERGIT